ncbi:MAG: DNA repair protein RadA [Gloeomargarita sp. SKYG116]|nr:DNA repair protein RadA [Gloeomargarita sp. SKYG116]MCS7225763.1 DNA repair protein RadA [Gloeomargarita sp. SKYB31]MDW8400325.1 DNA repair protein RadA [Gloeomargarita sp. SKYGB_i_bin116]
MTKTRSRYVCRECGAEYAQYFGQCRQCGAWNSLDEVIVTPKSPAFRSPAAPRQALPLSAVRDHDWQRLSTGSSEFDRVLGGGIVPGSLVLIAGDAGIGKSTLLLQTLGHLAQTLPVLYVCAEESAQQVKLRANRLFGGHDFEQLYLLAETDLEVILRELDSMRPRVAVIDSIQALMYAALTSAPGSVSQVRECTAALMRLAKQHHIALFIVGHITKEGAIAGPKVLEHLVDTVVYFEGDALAHHRLLRAGKNRFGPSYELGIFAMTSQGLQEVSNPSVLFLHHRESPAPGVATIVACEASRPLVVEIQALVTPTTYGTPRRSATGIDYNRLVQILAVLEKHLGLPLAKFDVYVASAGGLTVAEPAADLGIALAVIASFRNCLIQPDTVLIGELGLSGQIRPVQQMETRLKEAVKLGFQRAIIPPMDVTSMAGLQLIPVARLLPAVLAALPTGQAMNGWALTYEHDPSQPE